MTRQFAGQVIAWKGTIHVKFDRLAEAARIRHIRLKLSSANQVRLVGRLFDDSTSDTGATASERRRLVRIVVAARMDHD